MANRTATQQIGFTRDRAGYHGCLTLGGGAIFWKCEHRHRSMEEAYACATAEQADRLIEQYDFFQSEEVAV